MNLSLSEEFVIVKLICYFQMNAYLSDEFIIIKTIIVMIKVVTNFQYVDYQGKNIVEVVINVILSKTVIPSHYIIITSTINCLPVEPISLSQSLYNNILGYLGRHKSKPHLSLYLPWYVKPRPITFCCKLYLTGIPGCNYSSNKFPSVEFTSTLAHCVLFFSILLLFEFLAC